MNKFGLEREWDLSDFSFFVECVILCSCIFCCRVDLSDGCYVLDLFFLVFFEVVKLLWVLCGRWLWVCWIVVLCSDWCCCWVELDWCFDLVFWFGVYVYCLMIFWEVIFRVVEVFKFFINLEFFVRELVVCYFKNFFVIWFLCFVWF